MLGHPSQRYSDRKRTGKILSEFDRSPVQFILNIVQLLVLSAGLFVIGSQVGVFKTEFTYLQATVSDLARRVSTGFDVQAQENDKIKNAITDHTGKAIR